MFVPSNFLDISSEVNSQVYSQVLKVNFFFRFCSHIFSQVFSQVLKFTGFFTGTKFCDFWTKFSPCKIHMFFQRVFLCHMVFHRFFTGSRPIVYIAAVVAFTR